MTMKPFFAALDRLTRKATVLMGRQLHRASGGIADASRPRFATPAPGLVLKLPFEVSHPERMHIGRDVKLGPNASLKVQTAYPGGWLRHPDGDHVTHAFEGVLHIGDRVTATGGLQISAFERITIEDDVLFANNVFLSDGTHATTRGDVPYKFQGIDPVAPIVVGRGAWLGQNVVVMPGVRIGAFAVIGANAVVTRDVPDGSVAIGAPARVVRRWDGDAQRWVSVAPNAVEVNA